MTWSFKRELGRKVLHLLSIFFLLGYLIIERVFSKNIALLVLTFTLILMIDLEYVRLEWNYKVPLLSKLWKYRRPKEKNRLGGDVFLLIGAIISLAVFDIKIASAAILMTTFGDLAAALIGREYGTHFIPRLKDKAIEGCVAELVVDIIIGFLVLRHLGAPMWPIIIVMALTATFVETVAHKIDDNLLVPLFAGMNGQIVLYLMGLV